jgi:hypothetical protein
MQARIVREELQKCQKAEGINHYQVCHGLAEKYLELLKDAKVSCAERGRLVCGHCAGASGLRRTERLQRRCQEQRVALGRRAVTQRIRARGRDASMPPIGSEEQRTAALCAGTCEGEQGRARILQSPAIVYQAMRPLGPCRFVAALSLRGRAGAPPWAAATSRQAGRAVPSHRSLPGPAPNRS